MVGWLRRIEGWFGELKGGLRELSGRVVSRGWWLVWGQESESGWGRLKRVKGWLGGA